MTEIMNPYIAGAPVTEARMFFGREDVFDWIEKSLGGQYADHILVVHGQRRVGKTSVLKQLGNRLPEKYIPVFFDLQGRTHTTLHHFLWWLARETARVLKQERSIEIPAPEKDDFARDPEFFENVFLPGLQPSLKGTSLLFTFDEFDNLEESDVREELARPLTDYLRRLMGRGEINFIYSIGSSGRKLENMQAAYTEFFKTALYKKISFLSREQTHGLVTHPVEGVIEYDSAAVERIYAIASGHPYFTQLTCHELFARCQRTGQRSIALADVDAILDDVVERGTVNLKFVWDEASDIEKWSLAALAQLEKGENRLLADYLGKQRVRFSESDLTSALLHLREKDVLTPANGFVIHLLRLWLQKNRPIEQVREELTEANPIANRYIEIGQEFKDAGQFDKAIESFRDALNISANNLQAQVNIALAYAAQGQLEQAVIEFENALAIDDEDVTSRAGMCDAHLALGDAAIKKGKTKEAVLSYQRVLEINAEHLEARQRMAELSRQRAEKALTGGRDEEALGAFSEALKFTPEDAALLARVEKVRAEKKTRVLNAQFARSDKEAAARNWDKAILALNEALEIAPGEASILERIEKVKEKQRRGQLEAILAKVEAAEKGGRWDSAIAGLNEYLRVQPVDPVVQKRLADLLEKRHAAWLSGVNTRVDQAVKNREWDSALGALHEALQLEPGNAQMLAKLDQVQETRRKAELEDMLQRANQAVTGSRWDEAIDILNDGLVAYPDNETVKTRLVEARKAKRDSRLQSVLRLADTAVQAGRWDTAAASLQEVLANEPDNTEFQEKLVQVKRLEHASKLTTLRTQAGSLLKAEKFAESLAAWETYLALEPDDREGAQAQIEAVKKAQNLSTLYAEASGAYAKKNYEKAIELFKRIVVEDAEYKDTTDLLAESVRLRRTGHKTSSARLRKIWVTGGLVGVLVLAIGGGLFWLGKNGRLSLSALFTTKDTSALTGETITVNSLEDSGPGTLRQALGDAQKGDTITFDPSVFPPGRPATIFITSGSIDFGGWGEVSITIDASNAGVILDGSLAGDRTYGLYIGSSNNIVMGLRIVNFGGGGIYISGSNNRIGGDRTIGAGSLGQGNLLGNNIFGIMLEASAGGTVITGNYIGIDEFGQETMGNGKYGIYIVPSAMYHILPIIIGPDNVIAYNNPGVDASSEVDSGGIVIETVQVATTITGNAIFGNGGRGGIFYNLDEAMRTKYATPPVIQEFDRESGMVAGDACPDCSVDIFSTDTSDGQYFEGTVTADADGRFIFNKGEALTGAFPTATLTRDGKYTSEFSQASLMLNIQRAYAAIKTQAPDYGTSFDTWDFGELMQGARLEDGQLLITSTGDFVSAGIDTPASDKFAVQYDFFAWGDSLDGHCIFINDSGDVEISYPHIATVYNHGNIGFYLFPEEGVQEKLATGIYDPSISNTVTQIVLGDQVAQFLNGRLVFGVSDPRLRASYNQSTFTDNYPITCAYDNYTYWDLSGLELSSPDTTDEPPSQPAGVTNFYDPILAYLDSEPPTFEDDFSTNLNMTTWGFTSEGEVLGGGIGGGVLGVDDSLEYGLGVLFPTNGMLDAEDFVFEFDFTTDSEMEYIGMKFWDGGDSLSVNEGYTIRIYNSGNWSLFQNYNDSEIQSGTAPSYLEAGFNTLLLVGQKSNIVAFLNDELLFTALDLEGYKDNNAIIVKGKESGDGDASFDNIQFWNLEGVEFPTTDDTSTSPAWVTDFAEPILAAIAGYEWGDDGLGNYIDYRTWLDASCSPPDINSLYGVGLFAQNCSFSWKWWFTDFVIEMRVRMEPVTSREPDSGWKFHYRSLNGFTFFYDGRVQLAFGGDFEYSDAWVPGSDYNNITIIVNDQEHALFINDQPIYYSELPAGFKNGTGNWNISDPVTFESIQIWDLNEAKYGLP